MNNRGRYWIFGVVTLPVPSAHFVLALSQQRGENWQKISKTKSKNMDLIDITLCGWSSSFNWKWVSLAQMTYRLVEMRAPSCGCGKRMWATEQFQVLEIQNYKSKSSNQNLPLTYMYMLTQDSFCCKCSDYHITMTWRYHSYLLIEKGITDKSLSAQLHLHVLLCLGSCCQDVIYFGVSHERYERALTCLITHPTSRFYCKMLPGTQADTVNWCTNL